MGWSLLDSKLMLEGGDERTFVLSGRLPAELADLERRMEARGHSPTDIWRGFTIGNDQGAMPDHMLVVRTAEFVPPDELTLVGTIEGPR